MLHTGQALQLDISAKPSDSKILPEWGSKCNRNAAISTVKKCPFASNQNFAQNQLKYILMSHVNKEFIGKLEKTEKNRQTHHYYRGGTLPLTSPKDSKYFLVAQHHSGFPRLRTEKRMMETEETWWICTNVRPKCWSHNLQREKDPFRRFGFSSFLH